MKAMVLCAGYGTRLGELTHQVPKPMLPLHGHPLLSYHLSHLESQGFDQIAINLHFHAEAIRDWFGDGSRMKVRLTYSYEDHLLGTAGGLKKMEPFFRKEEAFLVQYGDVLTDQDFRSMVQFHHQKGALATLLLHQRGRSNSIVGIDSSNRITSFLERPADNSWNDLDSVWVNSGICICSPEIFDSIAPNTASDLPRDIFVRETENGRRLFGFPLTGYRCAIDSVARLEEARLALLEGKCKTSQQVTKPTQEEKQ